MSLDSNKVVWWKEYFVAFEERLYLELHQAGIYMKFFLYFVPLFSTEKVVTFWDATFFYDLKKIDIDSH